MAKIIIEEQTPDLTEEELRKRRDFKRVQSRVQQVSYGLRKKRLDKIRNKYWFLAVLIALLILVFMLT